MVDMTELKPLSAGEQKELKDLLERQKALREASKHLRVDLIQKDLNVGTASVFDKAVETIEMTGRNSIMGTIKAPKDSGHPTKSLRVQLIVLENQDVEIDDDDEDDED